MSTVSKTVNPGSNPGSPAASMPPRRGVDPGWGRPSVGPISFARMGGSATVGRGRRVAAIALAAGAAAALLALGPGVAPAWAACPHAGAKAHEIPLSKLRKAVVCLVNRERSKRDRSRLDRNGKLEDAAQDHTDVMLAKDCFLHKCPGEPGLGHRIKRSGYTKGRRSWRFAEDLGYEKTPRQMVEVWLESSFNRRNMLDAGFRDLGVGAGWGAPKRSVDDTDFATYTIVFALRRPRR